MSEYKTFLVHIDAHVAHVSFNRPDKANAMNGKAWEEMEAIFKQLDQDASVRSIVLSGEGRHFCAGIDLSLLMEVNQSNNGNCEGRKRERLYQIVQELQAPILAIDNCRKPVLAAVHGACIGAGIDIITACDMRYGAAGASYSVKEIDMGMVADLGTLQRLPRIISPGMARELAYTGRKFSNQEAFDMGLINRQYADRDAMLEEVMGIAREIATKSPLSIRGTKQVMNYARDHSLQDGLNQIALWNAAMLMSDDIMKAMQAAMTKSQPTFQD